MLGAGERIERRRRTLNQVWKEIEKQKQHIPFHLHALIGLSFPRGVRPPNFGNLNNVEYKNGWVIICPLQLGFGQHWAEWSALALEPLEITLSERGLVGA